MAAYAYDVEGPQVLNQEIVMRPHAGLVRHGRLSHRTQYEQSTAENPVQWLFLDLNAIFASCEQQENRPSEASPLSLFRR
jgi:hypothetical protein